MAYRDIEQSRHKSYDFFHIKQPVTLIFETDEKTVKIIGYVQENQPGIFSDAEETQIDIVCPDPWFYEMESTETIFSGIEPLFEFPFSNESLSQKLLIMGEIHDDIIATFNYRGDIPVGFVAEIYFLGPAKGIKIIDGKTNETLRIDEAALWEIAGIKEKDRAFKYGDYILVSTVPNVKGCWFVRDTISYDVLNAVLRDSDWPMIHPGENVLAYFADERIENIQFKITYDVAYEGL